MPPGAVTTTCTLPAAPAGSVAVTVVSSTTTTSVATFAPKVTTAVPVSAVPVIVIPVPPAIGPLLGFTPVTVGTAA